MLLTIKAVLNFLIVHKIIKSWTKIDDYNYKIELYAKRKLNR